ncbi:MAG: hypothetical protein JW891_06715 [Candidatus Lokiarchaeota archaeon]|nr:hypothetical protein [Candidatus Lokiarchaeota archaeon]
MNKKKNTILIVLLGLSIGITQLSFLLATGSHPIWEADINENELFGSRTISLEPYVFTLNRYDLYVFLYDLDISNQIIIYIHTIGTGDFLELNLDILASGSQKIKYKSNIDIPPGDYEIICSIPYLNYKILLTTHGLWNLNPDGKVPSDFELIIYIISSILTGLIVVGILFQLRAYNRHVKSIKKYYLQSPNNSTNMDYNLISQQAERNSNTVDTRKNKMSGNTGQDTIHFSLNQEELAQIESEINIEENEYICIVHKGPIIGPNYLCPHCKTFYCLECANALKEKGETCWSCHNEFK